MSYTAPTSAHQVSGSAASMLLLLLRISLAPWWGGREPLEALQHLRKTQQQLHQGQQRSCTGQAAAALLTPGCWCLQGKWSSQGTTHHYRTQHSTASEAPWKVGTFRYILQIFIFRAHMHKTWKVWGFQAMGINLLNVDNKYFLKMYNFKVKDFPTNHPACRTPQLL